MKSEEQSRREDYLGNLIRNMGRGGEERLFDCMSQLKEARAAEKKIKLTKMI